MTRPATIVTTTGQAAPPPSLDRVNNLIALTERLESLMGQEREILASPHPFEIAKFQDEKSRLSAVYAREMAAVRNELPALEQIGRERLQVLREATARFRQALDDHTRNIERVRFLTEGIVKAVADEVQKRAQPLVGYGRTPNLKPLGPAAPVPLAINTVV